MSLQDLLSSNIVAAGPGLHVAGDNLLYKREGPEESKRSIDIAKDFLKFRSHLLKMTMNRLEENIGFILKMTP